jgi:predicted PurR-regulated permease PerM
MDDTSGADRGRDAAANDPAETDPVLQIPLSRPLDVRAIALAGILVVLLLHTVRAAASILLPVALAMLAHFVLGPVARGLRRRGLPAPIAAALIVATGIGAAAAALILLSDPATEWIERAPRTLHELEQKLRFVQQPVARVVEASEGVEDLASLEKREKVVVQEPGFLTRMIEQTRSGLVTLAIAFALLFFTLASSEAFVRKVVRSLPRPGDRERAWALLAQLQREVSRYLVTISLVNVALGVVVAVAITLLGVPNPVLWGVVAGALNFVPFVGAVVTGLILAAVSFLSFDSVGRAVAVPLVFAAITGLEGLVVTPALLGRRLTLSPVVIFLSLLLWSWLFGVPGALIAVPMLAAFKIVCDHVTPLQRIGFLLGADPEML